MRVLLICLSLSLAACSAAAPVTPGASPTGVAGSPTADLATSCTGQPPTGQAQVHPGWPPQETFELIPILASSELAVGPNRVLLSLIDDENNQLASPQRPVEMRFYNLAADPAQPAVSTQAEYMPTTEALPGLYRATDVEFECWGEWGLEALTTEADGSQRVGRMIFAVRPTSSTPALGAPAPASLTPTAATPQEIAAISTDTQPDPDLYTTSVDTALAEGRPFLLIFSTPAFCATRTCGPALDIVKAAATDYGEELAFIHVEPYELAIVEGSPQLALDERNQPIVVESARQWGLPSEPFIFVVDAQGRVAAKMEGVAAEDEIRAALELVAD